MSYYLEQVRELADKCLLESTECDAEFDEEDGEVREEPREKEEVVAVSEATAKTLPTLSSLKKDFEERMLQAKKPKPDWIPMFRQEAKATVLQAAGAIFHDQVAPRYFPRLCCFVIIDLLNLENYGQQLSLTEANEVLLGATKLFSSDDSALRRMLYLLLKKTMETCDPHVSIMAFSCLTKDMSCDVSLFRANAIRVLIHLIDEKCLLAIERFMKASLVDPASRCTSASILAAIKVLENFPAESSDHGGPSGATIVEGWIPQIKTTATIGSNQQRKSRTRMTMVQFQALLFLCHPKIVQDERSLELQQWLVDSFLHLETQDKNKKQRQCSIYSPLSLVVLIRFAAATTEKQNEKDNQHKKVARNFLNACLYHKLDLVAYEAARVILCHLDGGSAIRPHDKLTTNPAVALLHRMSSSPSSKPAVRFAATKTLASLADRYLDE